MERRILEVIHSDICEMSDTLSKGSKLYFLTFINIFSKFTCVYLLRHEDEAKAKFIIHKNEVENMLNTKIKTLRSDRGGVYTLLKFSDLCESVGIFMNYHPNSPPTKWYGRM